MEALAELLVHHGEVERVNKQMAAQLGVLVKRGGGAPIRFIKAELDAMSDSDWVLQSVDLDTHVEIALVSIEDATKMKRAWDQAEGATNAKPA